MISEHALLYPNVTLGQEVSLGAFVIVGEPPQGQQPGELETTLGDQAIIRSHTVIYAGNRLGKNFQTGHGVLLRELNHIGDNVSIGSHSVVEHHVEIGNGVRIHTDVFVPEFSVLEDTCWIGPCVVLTNARYPRSPHVKDHLHGPRVRRGAKIGAGAVLLPGITIGQDALIGAGAVVTHDVPDGGVVVGNPARVTKYLDALDAYQHP
jgi:acetyltransferase-like isoleucine patch superfamily enzyme